LRETAAASSLREVDGITCKAVYEHARNGDAFATGITETTAEVLGLLCVNICSCFNPSRIVFAGGVIAEGNFLLDRIVHYYKKHVRQDLANTTKIDLSSLDGNAGIVGCGSLAMIQAGFGNKNFMQQKNIGS
jgi:glucokinase